MLNDFHVAHQTAGRARKRIVLQLGLEQELNDLTDQRLNPIQSKSLNLNTDSPMYWRRATR
jgi:hypothetical protein